MARHILVCGLCWTVQPHQCHMHARTTWVLVKSKQILMRTEWAWGETSAKNQALLLRMLKDPEVCRLFLSSEKAVRLLDWIQSKVGVPTRLGLSKHEGFFTAFGSYHGFPAANHLCFETRSCPQAHNCLLKEGHGPIATWFAGWNNQLTATNSQYPRREHHGDEQDPRLPSKSGPRCHVQVVAVHTSNQTF